MKTLHLLLTCATTCIVSSTSAQLFISEFQANPPGTDNSFEYVELVATRAIDFGVTPYSVVFANNGTATANGWVQGAAITYGFNITNGTVAAGDVVYVGGSSMLPTGVKLRLIDSATTPGDRFGNASTGGVLGNGGGNADGIAIFDTDIFSVTMNLRPVDAVFFGTGTGSAVVSGGAAGYELPVNDLYSGGKLQSTSFVAPDPASGTNIVASGAYDSTSGTWTTPRTWAAGPLSDGLSTLTVVPEPGTGLLWLAAGIATWFVVRRKS